MNTHEDKQNELKELIVEMIPGAAANIDPTCRTKRGFWIDVSLEGRKGSIQYDEPRGYGISSLEKDNASFGEGHDEVAQTAEDAVRILRQMLQRK